MTDQSVDHDRRLTVAVLGLGAMGLPMARRLAQAFAVRAFDIDPARRTLAADGGAADCATARDAASSADVVLVAVRNGEQLEQALLGDEGVVAAMPAGAIVLLTSTVGVEAVRAVDARLAGTGVALVDAPLSGGPARAEQGDLLILVGGDPADVVRARPVLDALGSTVTVVGGRPGDGQAVKTVNQLLCGVHIAAAAEALALAAALGLDGPAVLEALQAGAAGSFMLANRGPRMLEAYDEGGAEVLSRLDIFVKDLGIVGDAARRLGVPAPVAAAAEQLFLLGQAQGLGAADDSAVIRVVAPERRS
ncbi:MAG TPA: NAD(P)-dependent oxidoreductase [Amnibacterium sp.]